MDRHTNGFTLVELVAVIVILGILAVVAIPRLDTSLYRALAFHDKTIAALRFAQKMASSHRRTVCVTFPDKGTLQLNIDTDRDGNCESALLIPGSVGNQIVSGDPTNANFNPLPNALSFTADGAADTDHTLTLTGGVPNITITGTTGHVQ